jgi:small subunit ribosomal protein S8
MSIDILGNFLTIIRNGIARSKPAVTLPYSKLKYDLALLLQEEGFIIGVEVANENDIVNKQLKIFLKYVNNESVIHEITRVSKPSRRIYAGVGHMKPVIGGLGVSVLTTNKGLLTDKTAKKMRVGGEIICTVW